MPLLLAGVATIALPFLFVYLVRVVLQAFVWLMVTKWFLWFTALCMVVVVVSLL